MTRDSSAFQYASSTGAAYCSRRILVSSASPSSAILKSFRSSIATPLSLQVPQQAAKLLPRVVQIRASRSTRYSQHLAYLGVRKAFDVMKHDHRASARL